MERIIPLMFLIALILSIVLVWRYLKVIPNYKVEYLIECIYPIALSDLEKVPHLYQIKQLSPTKYSVHFNQSQEELSLLLMNHLSLKKTDLDVKQLHSWLKTNLWKNTP